MKVPKKRREDRLLCAGLIEVHWTGADGTALATIANLDDLSPGGVSLLLDCQLPRGTRVEFFHGNRKASGEVRYCVPSEHGWIAGVQFAPDSEWNPMVSPPEHLFDPKSIPQDAQLGEVAQLARKVQSSISLLVLGDAMRREEG